MDAKPEHASRTLPFLSSEQVVAPLLEAVSAVVRGKDDVVRQAVLTLLAGGHLLIEDVPGVGKTTLARALAQAMAGSFRRVQFTSDLMPGDILGVSVLDAAAHTFRFRPGPVFCHVLLADEINRTTPRTQSALLQSMEENQVTLDGTTHPLPDPFMVIATQNPLEHHGTYPLPESQMDRFLMRLSMGYPEREAEKDLVAARPTGVAADVDAVLTPAVLLRARRSVRDVQIAGDLLEYLMRLVEETREHPDLALGASPRASLALGQAARSSAYMAGRDFVIPDDIKDLAVPVLAHRLLPREGADDPAARRDQVRAILLDLVERLPVPL